MTTKKTVLIFGALCLVFFSAMVVKAGVTVVPATAFKAEDASDDYQIAWGGWGNYVFRKSGATESYAVAPVYLPDSVLIKNMRAHYMENDASNNANIGITRVNKYTGAYNTIYMITTSGASTSITYATDYSASPSPSAALTNLGALNYHAFIYYAGTGSDNFKCYGITIEWTPYP